MTDQILMRLLDAKMDSYGSMIVDHTKLPIDPNYFFLSLTASTTAWKTQGVKGVWLRMPISFSHFISIAANHGFTFHHAEPAVGTEEAYVMMVRWLQDSPSTLPEYASHTVGVGAFVIDDDWNVLVVAEKEKGAWKLPGGRSIRGESLAETAIREIKEETNIDCEFESIVCFLHFNPDLFNLPDLYFVVRMKPKTFNIIPQKGEIIEAKWLPIEEYKKSEKVDSFYKESASLMHDMLKNETSDISKKSIANPWKQTTFCDFYTINEKIVKVDKKQVESN